MMTKKVLWLVVCSLLSFQSHDTLFRAFFRNTTLLSVSDYRLNNYEQVFFFTSNITKLIEQDCRLLWQLALLPQNSDRSSDLHEDTLVKLLNCSSHSIPLVKILAPDQLALARQAVALYPTQFEAWIWLAELQEKVSPAESSAAYETGLALSPEDGLSWCSLGRLYEKQSLFQPAFEAFSQCCIYSDPGSNGCYGAGRMSERMNKIPQAIQYYHLSKWAPSRQRGYDLEQVAP